MAESQGKRQVWMMVMVIEVVMTPPAYAPALSAVETDVFGRVRGKMPCRE